MKILIGTPVNFIKDYSLIRFLTSIRKFTTPYDLLLVDNSEDPKYTEVLQKACSELEFENYEIQHIDCLNSDRDERVAKSREVIRQYALAGGYDFWCTNESDIIAPADSLEKLITLIGTDFAAVNHAYKAREGNNLVVAFGLSLIRVSCMVDSKEIITRGFDKQYGEVDSLMPNCYHGNERYFMFRLVREGLSYIDAYGVISPITHLNQ